MRLSCLSSGKLIGFLHWQSESAGYLDTWLAAYVFSPPSSLSLGLQQVVQLLHPTFVCVTSTGLTVAVIADLGLGMRRSNEPHHVITLLVRMEVPSQDLNI